MVAVNEKRMPNFLVIGAAKCGTTSLYHYLKQHPEVYMSPIKEPNHFSTDIRPESFSPDYKLHEAQKNLDVYSYVRGPMTEPQWGAYVHSETDYSLLFRLAGDKKRLGEISNSYLYSAEAAFNIHQKLKGVRLIAILRNPVDRAYSHYQANIRDGRALLPFRQELEADLSKPSQGWGKSHLYIGLGMYSEQIRRYKKYFGPDQLMILFFDDLKTDTMSVIKKVYRFLDIPDNPHVRHEDRHNEARVPKNIRLIHFLTQTGLKRKIYRMAPKKIQAPLKSLFFRKEPPEKMSKEDRVWLTGIFRNEILELSKETGRDLSHWLI
jgi:hypothetical protein